MATLKKYSVQEECPMCHELTGRTYEHDDKSKAHIKRTALMLGLCAPCTYILKHNKAVMCHTLTEGKSDIACVLVEERILKKNATIPSDNKYKETRLLCVEDELFDLLKTKQRRYDMKEQPK